MAQEPTAPPAGIEKPKPTPGPDAVTSTLPPIPSAGTVMTNCYFATPQGARVQYAYCSRWRITTDADIGAALGRRFRSSEHWQLVALNAEGAIVAIFPGCQIKSFVAYRATHGECCDFDEIGVDL